VTQDGVVELEAMLQLGDGRLIALDVHQHVVGLVHLLDRVGHLAAPPVFQAVDLAVAGGHDGLVALDHRRHLLGLVRVHDEDDFIMSHANSLRLVVAAPRHAVRWSKGSSPV